MPWSSDIAKPVQHLCLGAIGTEEETISNDMHAGDFPLTNDKLE